MLSFLLCGRIDIFNSGIKYFSQLSQCFHFTEPRHFFNTYGNLIKRISIQSITENIEYLNLLPEYCKNVEYMRIAIKSEPIAQLTFIERMQSVRHLHLEGNVDQNVVDEIIKLQNLEILEIYDAPLSGYRLNELRRLKELVLCRCAHVTTERFFKAFLVNRNIRRINIHGCRNMYPYAYKCMAENLQNLESLEFDADNLLDETFPNIRGFHQMKHMSVHNVEDSRFGEVILDQYAKDMGMTLLSLSCLGWKEFSIPKNWHLPKLVELNVHCSSVQQDVGDVLRKLGGSCPRLEKLTILVDKQLDDPVTSEAVLDFFRQSKGVVQADLPIWQCLNISLYKEIVGIRKAIDGVGRLTLRLKAETQNQKFKEIETFVKEREYLVTLRQVIELQLVI